MITIDDTLLYRFVARETDVQENAAVNKWAEDKENYDHLRKIYKVYMLSRFALNSKTAESIREEKAVKERQERRRKIFLRTVSGVAAAVLLGVFFLSGGYLMKREHHLSPCRKQDGDHTVGRDESVAESLLRTALSCDIQRQGKESQPFGKGLFQCHA